MCAASAARPVTIGHLGQSLDGYVATSTGDSQFVNDPQNIVHLHRMRALCDAVVVGGATVRDDDPQLTTRLASGDNPLRVIIDPRARLRPRIRCSATARRDLAGDTGRGSVTRPDSVRTCRCWRWAPIGTESGFAPCRCPALLARGCHAVFVEGGGITVSRFMNAGLLDRVQIAVAPLFIGHGRAGMRLAARQSLQDCLRPRTDCFAWVSTCCSIVICARRSDGPRDVQRDLRSATPIPGSAPIKITMP